MENSLTDKPSNPNSDDIEIELGDSPIEEINLDLDSLYDIGTGIHVISIAYNDNEETPHVDLGDCSPFIAITLLRAIIETLEIMLPPIDVSYKGSIIISNDFDFFDEENGENGDNGDVNE